MNLGTNEIKTFLVFVFIIGYTGLGLGQQLPTFNSYIHQPELYNPAALGKGHISFLHRRQWIDFSSNIAPVTFAFQGDISNILPFKRVGLAIDIKADRAHIFNRVNPNFSFAYHLINNEETKFSLGLTAGVISQRVDFKNAKVNLTDLALFDKNQAQTIFNGGFGLLYTIKIDKNIFSVDFALPQLFTNNFQYKSSNSGKDLIFDNRLHLRGGIRYRFNYQKIGIEPAIFFNGLSLENDLISKSTISLGLKTLYLEEKLWINGGVRINSQSLFLGIGGSIFTNLNFNGIMEYHTQLGSSYEFGISYKIGKNKRLETVPISVDNESVQLNDDKYLKVRYELTAAENILNQLKNQKLNNREIKNKIIESENHLTEAKFYFEDILNQSQNLYNSLWTSKRKIQQSDLGIDILSKDELEDLRNFVKEVENDMDDKHRRIYKAYISLCNRINSQKLDQKIEKPITHLIKEKDDKSLKLLLQNKLSKIPTTDKNISVSSSIKNTVVIEYKFPFIENSYEVDYGMNTRNTIMDHVVTVLQSLQKSNMKVRSIELTMLLQDELNGMEHTLTMFPYLGDLESEAPILGTVNISSTNSSSKTAKKIQINPYQKTSVIDLAFLKMYGIKKYIKTGIPTLKTDFQYYITGPNYQEESSQTILIKIKI